VIVLADLLERTHQEPAHRLPDAPVLTLEPVRDFLQLPDDLAPPAGLFADLAERGLLARLPGRERAFRQCPHGSVAQIARTDQEDAALLIHDEPAGGILPDREFALRGHTVMIRRACYLASGVREAGVNRGWPESGTRRSIASGVREAGVNGGGGAAAERAFVESLRGRDPAGAERYVALRDAREQAIAELRRVEAQYAAAGSELRPVFLSPLKAARRTYAARSLAVLDFLGSTRCSRHAARHAPGSRSS